MEETLRRDAGIQYLPLRSTAEEVVLAGVRVPKGEALLMGFGSAGRDSERYGEDAHAFDVIRSQRGHLAFSHVPHFRLGAGLERLEGTIALEALSTRFRDLRLAEGRKAEGVPSIIASGRASLPEVLGQGTGNTREAGAVLRPGLPHVVT